jgi:glutamine phosphoribosylpyrophosphate amidotransferase
MLEIFGEQKGNFCAACFDGNYPVDVTNSDDRTKQLGLFE